MSASDNDIDKQVKRHRPSLLAIIVAVLAVGAIGFGVFGFGADPEVDEAGSSEPLPAADSATD